jgi:AraC-like DNA-binding protein
MWIAHSFLSIVLVLHLLVVIIRSWNQDLVAVRRLFRGPFMAVIALYCLLQSGLQIAEAAGVNLPLWRFVEAVALALLTLAGAIGFLRSRPELFVAAPAPQALASPLDSARASVAPADVVAASRLEQLMAEGEIWRREGLTIGALADAVGVAEHRLRRLINQTLGYRNFADFLNGRRIEAAKVSLADPAKGRESISALAFDLGFASLGPFNRAFRDATGETPTAWRARALADLQNPSSNLKSPSNGARQGSG